jgi:hypothetical protein
MHCAFIFSTPYSTVLTINVSTYALSIKKIFQLINPSLCKNDVNYRYVCCRKLGEGSNFLFVLLQYLYMYVVCYMVHFILCMRKF